MSASFDAKMTEGMSAFRMFEQLTVNRSHNKGTLSVERNRAGQVVGLQCVNHHFWNRLSNTTDVTIESANDLRSVFEQAINEELKGIFYAAIQEASDDTSACEGNELLAKIKEIKDAFHNAIFPAGCDDKLIKFERKDIRKIVLNVNELRNFGSARALLNVSVSDLCRLATDSASSARAAAVSDKSSGPILQVGNHALALIKTAPKDKLLEIGNDLLKTIDKDMEKYPADFEVINGKCDWIGRYNEFKDVTLKFIQDHASDPKTVTMTDDEQKTFKGFVDGISKNCEDIGGFCSRFLSDDEFVVSLDLPGKTIEDIKSKAREMLDCIEKVQEQYRDFLDDFKTPECRTEAVQRMASDVNLEKLAGLSKECAGIMKALLDKEVGYVNEALKDSGVKSLICTEKGLVLRDSPETNGKVPNIRDLRNDVGILIRAMMDRVVDVNKDVEDDKQGNLINAKLLSRATCDEIQTAFQQVCKDLEPLDDEGGIAKINKEDMSQGMVNTLGTARGKDGRSVRFGTYIAPSPPKVSKKKKGYEPTLLNCIEQFGTETECRFLYGKSKWKLNLRLFSDKIKRECECDGKRFPEAFENFVDAWVKSIRPPDHYTDAERMLVKAAVVKVLKFCAPGASKNIDELSNYLGECYFERTFFGAGSDDPYVGMPAEEIQDEVVPLFEEMFGNGPVAKLDEERLEAFLQKKHF